MGKARVGAIVEVERCRHASWFVPPTLPNFVSAGPLFGVKRLRLNIKPMTAIDVRRAKAALSSGCKPHPANSLPPEATGAVMEMLWGERRTG
ncbi:MAG: hypothetical protein WB610_16075 [Rhodomicrobium sp.]